jgi:hypothetical protein
MRTSRSCSSMQRVIRSKWAFALTSMVNQQLRRRSGSVGRGRRKAINAYSLLAVARVLRGRRSIGGRPRTPPGTVPSGVSLCPRSAHGRRTAPPSESKRGLTHRPGDPDGNGR